MLPLYEEAIDYAGVYPPAGLPAAEAASCYREYWNGPNRFALGRLVWPADRLNELAEQIATLDCSKQAWKVSAVAAKQDSISAIQEFNQLALKAKVDTIEIKAAEVSPDCELIARWHYNLFLEVTVAELAGLPEWIGQNPRAYLKLRTGGLQAGAFPAPESLFEFVWNCCLASKPYKFTAGLHHLATGDYSLTYSPDSAKACMFGSTQLLLASAYLGKYFSQGSKQEDLQRFLKQLQPDQLGHWNWSQTSVEWDGVALTLQDLQQFRRVGCKGFGSCSFSEPIEEMTALGWIL